MAFDVQAARQAGYSEAEIADYLAQQRGFDAAGARSAGYSDADILAHLSQPTAPQSPRDEWKAELAKVEKYDPTEGMSGGQKFLAGVGKGMTDVARGVGQAVGVVSRDDVKEARRLDQALTNTGAGAAGNVVGALAAYAPTALIPGANTLGGAAAIGAASGLLAPSASTQETATNTITGGLLAPGALVAARAVPATWQGGKALLEPFTKSGQNNIAARTMVEFAGGPEAAQKAAQAMRGASPALPGVQNTAAEVSGNAGIAQLERAMRQNPTLSQSFAERLSGNRSAMLEGLQGIAGDDAAMSAAVRAREAAAAPGYASSKAANILPDQQFAELAKRPAMQKAMARAESLMSESGAQQTPGEFMHAVKMALDDMLETGPQMGIGKSEANAIKSTRSEFIKWLEQQSPDYAAGREAFKRGSQPINQMEVGKFLLDRFQPALADFGADTRTTAATYAKALRDADATAAKATGFPGARMADVLTPEQFNTATGVAKELAKRAKADELGRIPGSNTAQNLVSQNMLRQVLGPFGLPESAAESTILRTVMRGPQFVAKMGEERVLERLARGLLSPEEAAALLEIGARRSVPMRGLLSVEPYVPAAAIGSMNGAQ